MSENSDRKTANEPLSGTDPGGTRPAPSTPDKPATPRRPPVESGDENDPGVPAGTRP